MAPARNCSGNAPEAGKAAGCVPGGGTTRPGGGGAAPRAGTAATARAAGLAGGPGNVRLGWECRTGMGMSDWDRNAGLGWQCQTGMRMSDWDRNVRPGQECQPQTRNCWPLYWECWTRKGMLALNWEFRDRNAELGWDCRTGMGMLALNWECQPKLGMLARDGNVSLCCTGTGGACGWC